VTIVPRDPDARPTQLQAAFDGRVRSPAAALLPVDVAHRSFAEPNLQRIQWLVSDFENR